MGGPCRSHAAQRGTPAEMQGQGPTGGMLQETGSKYQDAGAPGALVAPAGHLWLLNAELVAPWISPQVPQATRRWGQDSQWYPAQLGKGVGGSRFVAA